MRKTLIASITSALALTVLLGVLYPLLITGVGQVAFPGNANGQLVHRDGRVVASTLIGQQFTDVVRTGDGKVKLDSDGNPVTTPDRRFFQTRPSGTSPADNAAGSSFANQGPNNKATADQTQANITAYLALERPYTPGLTVSTIPIDAVTTSASGIDPDISPANAAIQAHRIAAVDHMPLARVMALVHHDTGGRGLGFSGNRTVNVVALNLALSQEGHA